MSSQLGSATIVIVSILMYQTFIKAVPEHINPINALLTFYITALVCTLIAAKLLPATQGAVSISEFSWAAAAVGVAIVGIELGYLLMYRSGWHLATAPLITMGAASILLLPISLLVFQQPWSTRYLFGIGFCLLGLYLLAPQD
ncbi:MAG: hypothetical protein AB8B48_10780 [Pseudomonadales bacterium]